METAPELDWLPDGTPVSRRYGDRYFSTEDGLQEARHVFLAGNDLPARFRPGFRIAETGFGTGLNFLATWEAWEASGLPGPLHFTSFEIAPLTAEAMARALARWPTLAPRAAALVAALPLPGRVTFGPMHLTLVEGDARETLPRWKGEADAWFLDGFSPARNPELWSPDLLSAIAAHTAPGGSFASFTAAGHVRRALSLAGFRVEKRRGFGRKREMSAGRLAAQ